MTAPIATSLPSLSIVGRPPVVSAGSPSALVEPNRQPRGKADSTATLRILCQALGAGTVEAARQQLVGGLAEQFGAQGVALGWQRPGKLRWLFAVSKPGTPHRRSDYGRALEAAFAETWLQATTLRWPEGNINSTPVPPTYRQLASLTGAAYLLGIPLRRADGDPPAALLIWGEREKIAGADSQSLISDVAGPLAGLIRLLYEATPSKSGALMRWFTRSAGRRRWLALAGVAVLAAVALVPLPGRVSCSCTLEPQTRRFIVAPFDGTLEKTLVQPGDPVTAGQPLALLDKRSLEMELAILQGQADEAQRRRDAARAKNQAAVAQMAELEAAQALAKIAHLRHQLEQLTVQSPITGVVVRGDLKRVEGAPLTRGQSLFEVAPLSSLVAELAIPEEEIRLVRPGMPVTVRAAALPGVPLHGQIDRIHPRAEIRDRRTIFIAEVTLDNEQRLLMPGMEAQATAFSDAQPLGWILVRRPLARVARWMGW